MVTATIFMGHYFYLLFYGLFYAEDNAQVMNLRFSLAGRYRKYLAMLNKKENKMILISVAILLSR